MSWSEVFKLNHYLNLEIVRALPVAYPTNKEEQRETVAILEAIDRKIDLYRRKRAVLDELFKALLHKLMTGEVRVGELDLSYRDAREREPGQCI